VFSFSASLRLCVSAFVLAFVFFLAFNLGALGVLAFISSDFAEKPAIFRDFRR